MTPELAPIPLRSSSQALQPARRQPGRTLPYRLGRYTLFDHVGRGGMADIYLATERIELGASRLVCIKEVLTKFAENERFTEMLVAEAKLAARLGHANVVSIESLEREAGSLFIAMEYVEGFDLRELLRRCASDRVPLPVEFSLLVVTEALRGLDYAHRFRDESGEPLCIVHRDVSPSNVLISFEGEVKLCDFGIARAHAAAAGMERADATGEVDDTIAGKAGYMSPEQATGDPLDARSDVFAAGIILWELLSGRRLYKAHDDERLLDVARRAEVPPLVVRGLPREEVLHAIARRALSRSRDERYPSAGAMLRDLADYAASAHMSASAIRFGEWLMEHFGRKAVSARRGRQRALQALERGPAALLRPVGMPMDGAFVSPLDAIPVHLESARPPAVEVERQEERTPPEESGPVAIVAVTNPAAIVGALAEPTEISSAVVEPAAPVRLSALEEALAVVEPARQRALVSPRKQRALAPKETSRAGAGATLLPLLIAVAALAVALVSLLVR